MPAPPPRSAGASDLAQNGAAVIVISQDLDELLEVSDRFCALNEGRLSAPAPGARPVDGGDRPDAGRGA
jgi:ABC-type sugar transport system ATPase subunit